MSPGSTAALSLFDGARDTLRSVRDLRRHAGGLSVQQPDQRAQAEFFIRDVFGAAYGARLGMLMPTLLADRDAAGGILAACGLREASRGALFLERYLEAPVEHMIGARVGMRESRAHIVEVGNLAVRPPYTARRLIESLTRFLLAGEAEWVVFTAVATLRNAFSRLNVPFVRLGAACLDALPVEERSAWGRYYDTAPEVLAVRVRDAAHALLSRPHA